MEEIVVFLYYYSY